MSSRPGIRRWSAVLVRAVLAGTCAVTACCAGAAGANVLPGDSAAPPCRLAGPSLDFVPALVTGTEQPTLILAQRAIERDLHGTPTPEEPYAVVDIPGWKSEGGSMAMSLAIPGTGQLYNGSKRGYLYLGVEAVALLSYASFSSKSDVKRDEYYSYVGDPNSSTSRFSFDRLAGDVSPEELSRLRTIYEKDKAEFYQAVTLQDQYAAGWQDPAERSDAAAISNEATKQDNRSRLSLYTLVANHLVSAFDALNLARLNNIALRDNMTLKLKLRPGVHKSAYAFSLTQKF